MANPGIVVSSLSLHSPSLSMVDKCRGRAELAKCLGASVNVSSSRLQFTPTTELRASSPMTTTRASFPFDDESIGAEYGEGFATFRPMAPLQMDVDFMNDRMQKRGVERVRLAMRPDEAYGVIFSLDNVIAETREARIKAWRRLASHTGHSIPDRDPRVLHCLAAAAPMRCLEVLSWPQSDTEPLLSKLSCLYDEELREISAPVHGLKKWLQALRRVGVPCAVACSLSRQHLSDMLDRLGIGRFFQAVVTREDGMDSVAHRLLSAAVKLDRQPCKCVVFEDDPRGVAAAHNCSMKAVALIGLHPAYELKQSDLTISSYTQLSVMNVRRLFANRGEGVEFMELRKQREDKPQNRRPRPSTTH